MSFYDRVYEIVKRIPEGKVSTYGQIALLLGSPRASRAVGYALHHNPYFGIVPCHRVVNREGRLARTFAFGGEEKQRAMLEAENIKVSEKNIVDLKIYGWDGR